MCVYSLNAARTRKGIRGESLVTHRFAHAVGFVPAGANPADQNATAVCMSPGAEIAFDKPPQYPQPKAHKGIFAALVRMSGKQNARPVITDMVATLVEVAVDRVDHKLADALKFPSLQDPVLLEHLAPGQSARILKLSVQDEPVHSGTPTEAPAELAHV